MPFQAVPQVLLDSVRREKALCDPDVHRPEPGFSRCRTWSGSPRWVRRRCRVGRESLDFPALTSTPLLLLCILRGRHSILGHWFGTRFELLPTSLGRSGLDKQPTLPDDELLPDVQGYSHLPKST